VGAVLALGAFFLASFPAAPLRAQPTQEDQREVNARQLFAVGKYAEALEIFGKLYAETAHPTYLRNIGRCYQNLGDPDRAIASFREYLRQGRSLPDDQRKVIEGYIAEMEELKRKQASERPKAEDAPPPVAPEPAPAAAVVPVAPPPLAPPAERRTPTAAYVVGGVSVVALAVGAVFGVLAISNDHEADPDCPMDVCNAKGRAANEAAVRDARIADVALGAGLVGAGIATYLYLTRGPAAAPKATARRGVRPTLGAGVAGLGLEARW
jgi:tetratricopeptide (TPR) repeat protein